VPLMIRRRTAPPRPRRSGLRSSLVSRITSAPGPPTGQQRR
jgi:hypothetical protein